MGIFKRGPRAAGVKIVKDLTEYDEDLRQARDEVVRTGRWEPAGALLAATGRDWPRRNLRVGVLADIESRGWLETWQRERPGEPDALVIAADAGVARAWEARGSGWAKDTSREAFDTFFRLLDRAQDLCEQAVAAAPEDPTPWVTMVTLAMGQQRDREYFDAVWKELTNRDPYHPQGHTCALQYLAAKWHGSHEEMFGFARSAAAAAPPGSPLVLLPLQAHVEYVLYESDRGERPAPPELYWGAPERQADLDQALARWRPGDLRSLQMRDRSPLACALGLSGRLREAADQFEAMGHRVHEYPWYYLPGKLREMHGKAMATAR
jgi:hypothetical protein